MSIPLSLTEQNAADGIMVLPFPRSGLSGHANGKRWGKSKLTKQWRTWAFHAALEAKLKAPQWGEIHIEVAFYLPNRRGDRTIFATAASPSLAALPTPAEVRKIALGYAQARRHAKSRAAWLVWYTEMQNRPVERGLERSERLVLAQRQVAA